MTKKVFKKMLLSLAFTATSFNPLISTSQVYAAASSDGLEIWFVRHAESEVNVTKSRDKLDKGVSYPLTRKGVLEAKLLADQLRDVPIFSIYTSTRLRAIQTADAVAFQLELPIKLAPEMVEIDIGAEKGEKNVEQIWRPLAKQWQTDLKAKHGNGESVVDVQNRVSPFVRSLIDRYTGKSGVVLVAAHGGSIQMGVEPFCDKGKSTANSMLGGGSMPYTGLFKLSFDNDQVTCVRTWDKSDNGAEK